MRTISRMLFIAIFATSTLTGTFAQAKSQNDTTKTKITFNTKNPQAISVVKEQKPKISLVFDKKSAIPLKGQKTNTIKIVPGESNFDKEQRIAREQTEKRRIQKQPQSQFQPVQVIRVTVSPGSFDALYQAAGSQFGVPWQILAAVHSVESGQSGDTSRSSYAGATGPMQFLPSTFRAYAVDGNGDGTASIYSVADSIFTAARYVSANIASTGSLDGALLRYNHSWSYVNKVLAIARGFGL